MKEPKLDDLKLKRLSELMPLIIVSLVVFLVLVPLMFFLFVNANFQNAGTIGDLIGGTTAPIIGLLSTMLIYYSFKAQIRANERVQDQINHSQQENNFLFLVSEFEKVSDKVYGYKGSDVYESGPKVMASDMDLIANYIRNYSFDESKEYFIRDINNLLRISDDLLNILKVIKLKITESELLELSTNHRTILNNKYWLLYLDYVGNCILSGLLIESNKLNHMAIEKHPFKKELELVKYNGEMLKSNCTALISKFSSYRVREL